MATKPKLTAEGYALLHRLGQALIQIACELEDEGDRVYLGSTNDADELKALRDAYDRYRFDHNDLGPESE